MVMASPADSMEVAGGVDDSALEGKEIEGVAAKGAPTSRDAPATAGATATTGGEPAAGEELTKVRYSCSSAGMYSCNCRKHKEITSHFSTNTQTPFSGQIKR